MAGQIPLVVALWEHVGFGGRKRVLAEDEPNLVAEGFNDVASAVGVHPGPDYTAWKLAHGGQEPTVALYEDVFYGGAALILTNGAYPDIHRVYNFGDVTSSVRFNPTATGAAPITPVALVVHIYKDANFSGERTQIVENVPNIISYLGGDWNDVVSSVWVETTPHWIGQLARLHRDVGFVGGHIDLGPGAYPDLNVFGFNDVTSSIQIS